MLFKYNHNIFIRWIGSNIKTVLQLLIPFYSLLNLSVAHHTDLAKVTFIEIMKCRDNEKLILN